MPEGARRGEVANGEYALPVRDSVLVNMEICNSIQEHLKAYLDGELPLRQRVSVGWHLLRCPDCREARKTMTEISSRISIGESNGLDPALRARILSSVSYADGGTEQPRRPRAFEGGRRLLLLGGATAAGLLAIIIMRPVLPNWTHAASPDMNRAATAMPGPAQRAGGGVAYDRGTADNAMSSKARPEHRPAVIAPGPPASVDGKYEQPTQPQLKVTVPPAAPSGATQNGAAAQLRTNPPADAIEEKRKMPEHFRPASASDPSDLAGSSRTSANQSAATVTAPRQTITFDAGHAPAKRKQAARAAGKVNKAALRSRSRPAK